MVEKTKRVQNNNIMSQEEKEGFTEIIKGMAWLYEPIKTSIKKYSHCGSLIDVACGDGHLLYEIRDEVDGLDLTGLDIDEFFITIARERGLINFICSDVFSLVVNYDIVTCNLALHHFENPTELIVFLSSRANNVLILSDQLRPEDTDELERRLNLRKELVGDGDVDYYEENEVESILEAYSKEEIIDIFDKTGLNYTLSFFDNDYYERFVAEIKIK